MKVSTKHMLVGAFVTAASLAHGQSMISAYNFERVGEFHMANPSAYQPYRAVVGIPGIGMQSTYVHNSSFDLAPVISSGLNGNESIEYILDNVSEGDRLLIDQTMDIAYVGFRTGKGFWSLGVQVKNQVSFEYPVEILNLAYYGSVPLNGQINMSNNETTLNSYLTYHVGYQHELMDGKMRVGGRLKYLSGLAHMSSTRTDLQGTFNSDVWTFNTDIETRVATVLNVDDPEFTGVNTFLFSDNKGYAFDLGVSYEVMPNLEVSIAALDIGSVTWSTNTRTYASKGQYTWEGVEYSYGEEGSMNGDSILNDIVDALNFQETAGGSFTQALPRSYMAGARYQLHPKHGFGATYQLNQWGDRTFNTFGVSYIGNWSKWFSFYANYAVIDGDNLNVGVGFSLNLGPIQLYLLTDDVMSAQLSKDLNMANIRFGMNVALYRKDLKGYEVAKEPALIAPPSEEAAQSGSEEGESSSETEDENNSNNETI